VLGVGVEKLDAVRRGGTRIEPLVLQRRNPVKVDIATNLCAFLDVGGVNALLASPSAMAPRP
jgi:hypothetical protein